MTVCIEGQVRQVGSRHTLLARGLPQPLLEQHECIPHGFVECSNVDQMAAALQQFFVQARPLFKGEMDLLDFLIGEDHGAYPPAGYEEPGAGRTALHMGACRLFSHDISERAIGVAPVRGAGTLRRAICTRARVGSSGSSTSLAGQPISRSTCASSSRVTGFRGNQVRLQFLGWGEHKSRPRFDPGRPCNMQSICQGTPCSGRAPCGGVCRRPHCRGLGFLPMLRSEG